MPSAADIAAVRRFSRFYTRQIGALDEGLLGSSLSLTEARIVYEIANRTAPTATEVGQDLGLDAGYLSRILKSLAERGLVERAPHPTDGRRSLLALTSDGRAFFRQIDEASCNAVDQLLDRLAEPQRARLVAAMSEIESLLSQDVPAAPGTITLRQHRPGDIGHVISRHAAIYSGEYGWDISFESLVAKVAAEFLDQFDPISDRSFIAERDGAVVGSAFVVRKDERTAKLRLVYVEANMRGTGLGRQLVEAAMGFARQAGYRRMTLWTNDILIPARRLYESLDFKMVACEPHHSFGVDLVSETWERDL